MNMIKSFGIKLLLLFPLILLLIYWYVFSIDIPWYDDVMVIAFNRNVENQGFNYQVFRQLIANYNEHIIVITKLIFWLNYKCFGYLNLSFLALQGMLFYISFILILLKYIGRSVFSSIIILFILSSLIYDEGYLWAMSSISNFASLLFTLMSIINISRQKIKLSLFFLFLGLISCAQTLIYIPIFILISYYHEKLNWKILFFIILLLVFYFSGYEKTGIRPDLKSVFNSFNKERIYAILTFYAIPFGSLGIYFNIIYAGLEFLLFLFVIYKIIFDFKKKQLTKRKIILASLLLWSYIIISFTFVVRVELESRYLIYSNIKTACIFLYFLEIKPNKKIAWCLSFLSILFFFITLFPALIKAKNTHLEMNGLKHNLLNNKMVYFFSTDDVDARKIKPYYKDLGNAELIKIPNRLNGRLFNHLLLFNQISNEQMRSIKFEKKLSSYFNLNYEKPLLLAKNIVIDSSSKFIVYQNNISSKNLFDSYAILLKSNSLQIQFNYKTKIPTITQYLFTQTLMNHIVIYKNTLPYGDYDMYLIKN